MAGTTSSESVIVIPTTQHKADDFNRLLTSNKNSGQSAFRYDYDCYSNRWHQSLTSRSGTTSGLDFDANNHILSGTGVTHDPARNATNGGSDIYTFDAENHIICVPVLRTLLASTVPRLSTITTQRASASARPEAATPWIICMILAGMS